MILLLIDSVILILSLIFAFSIRLGYWYWPEGSLYWLIFLSPVIALPIFIRFGLYRSVIRYINFNLLWNIFKAVSLYALIWGILAYLSATKGIPRSVVIVNWIFAIVSICGIRMILRWLIMIFNNSESINVAIYGAGSAGRQLSIALDASDEYNPVAFIDDDDRFFGSYIGGIEVYKLNDIEYLINKEKITEVLLAVPQMSGSRRREIINFLEPFRVHVRSLPGVSELAQGKVKIADLREVSIKDLMGRVSVEPNKKLMSLNISNKVVMVTGAGGSIGSELCKQILKIEPKVLVLYELSEIALYNIDKELSSLNQNKIKIYPLLGSTTDKVRLDNVIESLKVNTIYHAAAYKHVPIVEFNSIEGVKNNIVGTLECAKSAIKFGVETFVLISTDKAVRPTNTMGATKRFSEIILQALNKNSLFLNELSSQNSNQNKTKFSMVRFGNVLGSSGSVIPLFKEQISKGGPVTVTSREVERYFMSISEAVELVIQAGAMTKGGDVFVLDMGKPIKILDLAIKMIRLSGLELKDKNNPSGDIEVEFSGLRPGEKLYEELIIGNNTSKTENPMIMRAMEDMIPWEDLDATIMDLKEAINSSNHSRIQELLIKIVPEFTPEKEIFDHLFSVNKSD